RELLKGKQDGRIACLPQGMLTAERWLREAQRQFREIAQIEVIDTESMEASEMEAVLRRADVAHIPDGNAYLLIHRLQTSRIMAHLKKKIQNGLPVVACGAGAVLCGPNILTSTDLNLVPTQHFDALGVTPFSMHVRYVDDAERDDWISEYHVFHDNPVLLLEEGACVRISGKATTLRLGNGWIQRPGQEKSALKTGEPILVNGAKT
ncbi:MAG TPA: Type 1 glutamine amidotransferase-like domain-containing protein, partial [Anaerolineales bacterium]|nr:Type 1 glutamine amidotransferase-like domain-containing protein [Anaerolineales bacterium]